MIKIGTGPCAYCTKETKLRCSQCKNVFICSNECNSLFHPVHKPNCFTFINSTIVNEGLNNEVNNTQFTSTSNKSLEKLGKCYICNKETSLRCGKCKSVLICSSECMNSFWPSHKVDCKKLKEASTVSKQIAGKGMKIKEILQENAHKDAFDKSQKNSRPVTMDGEMFEFIKELDDMENTIKVRYGITKDFEKESGNELEINRSPKNNDILKIHSGSLESALDIYKSLSKEKQLCLITDLMEIYDSGSEMNKSKNLPTRMILNRKFNNLTNLANTHLFLSQEDKRSFYNILLNKHIGDEARSHYIKK